MDSKYNPSYYVNIHWSNSKGTWKRENEKERKTIQQPNKKRKDKQKFYPQLKIHKEANPGRPVVSSVNYHTTNISKYVDYHLQTIIKEIPSYAKDTQDFLKKLEKVKDIPQESLLVTLRRKVTIYKHSK